MKNDIVDIVVLIDRSASMSGMEDETVGAFNSFLADQKKVEGEAVLTLVLFDHQEEIIHFQTPLNQIEPLTRSVYTIGGNTSMYDCLGNVMSAMKYANKSGKVIFLIQSDGQENTSQLYNGSRIKKMISEGEEAGWDFEFIGTGIDAITEGAKFGLAAGKCMSVGKTTRGFETYGSTISTTSTTYRGK